MELVLIHILDMQPQLFHGCPWLCYSEDYRINETTPFNDD